ncbi:MAG: rod shape-determining protein MreD [Candidatus Glassbacteria bacterium]
MISRKRTVALIFLLLLCQLVIRRKISYVNGSTGQVLGPDFLLLSVVFAGLGRGVVWGVVTGFFIGLVQDSFAPMYFGMNALIKVMAGFVSGRVGARVFLHTSSIVFFLIVGLKYLNDLLCFMFGYMDGYRNPASQLLFFSPGSALYTSITGLILFWIMVYLNETPGRRHK